jgi:hypothetical protein
LGDKNHIQSIGQCFWFSNHKSGRFSPLARSGHVPFGCSFTFTFDVAGIYFDGQYEKRTHLLRVKAFWAWWNGSSGRVPD